MFCDQCGKPLSDGSRFCVHCGNPLPQVSPAPAEKKSRKGLPILCLVLIVALLAGAAVFLIPRFFPSTTTVYLVTSYTSYRDGEPYLATSCEYDERGNLLSLQTKDETGTLIREYRFSYDENGYLTEKTEVQHHLFVSETRYEYDCEFSDDGHLEECTTKQWFMEQHTASVDYTFTYDENGRIILVESEDPNQAWQHYEYDKDGALIQETFCQHATYDQNGSEIEQSVLYRYCYEYDKNGNLDEVTWYGASEPGHLAYDETEDLNFKKDPGLSYALDDLGLSYDENGLWTFDDLDPSIIFDEEGNLVSKESDSGFSTEYVYEAFQVSSEEAAWLRRFRHTALDLPNAALCGFLDPFFAEVFPMYYYNHNNFFYYYLIPNPLWDTCR